MSDGWRSAPYGPEDQCNDQKRQENEEQNLGNAHKCAREPAETENRRGNGENEKYDRPRNHVSAFPLSATNAVTGKTLSAAVLTSCYYETEGAGAVPNRMSGWYIKQLKIASRLGRKAGNRSVNCHFSSNFSIATDQPAAWPACSKSCRNQRVYSCHFGPLRHRPMAITA